MNFCVIGYGRGGKNLHNTLINLVGKEKVFVYDSDFNDIDNYKNLNILDSLDDLSEIENILIATPASTHYSLSKKFLEDGKNIFCEKPVSLSTAEVNDLMKVSKEQDKVFLVGHTFLFNDSINYIKDNIDKDNINLKIISGRYSSYSTNVHDVDVLWDFGPHVVSIANYIVDSPVINSKILPLYYDDRGKLSVCNITLEYKNGINAIFELSWLSIDKKREIDFIGESKMYRWNDLKPSSPVEYIEKVFPEENISGPYKHFHTILNKTEVPPIKQSAPLENELNYFVESIKNKKNFNLTSGLEFSRNVVEIIESLNNNLD